MDGMTWLMNSPDESLAYILADSGFDVWISNTHGTRYSLRHTSLGADDGPYWDWTWDQLVAYELPAIFQYVHDQTGQKLHYVGHSLGTLIAFAAFSRHMLLDKLSSTALLSPIAYMGQMSSPITRAGAEDYMGEALLKLGYPEFDPKGAGVSLFLLKVICQKPHVNCYDLMASFTVVRDNTIAMYDYGSDDENMKHYRQSKPPAYSMTSIPNDLPLFLGYGGQDALSNPDDVHALLKNLTNHDADKLVVQYLKDCSCRLCYGCEC